MEFISTIENTSDFNFKNLYYNVPYKDGVFIGNNLICLEEFTKRLKQKIKLLLLKEVLKV